jgi:hypothetical protein
MKNYDQGSCGNCYLPRFRCVTDANGVAHRLFTAAKTTKILERADRCTACSRFTGHTRLSYMCL